jgi:UvrD-like helicase C-terminal domain
MACYFSRSPYSSLFRATYLKPYSNCESDKKGGTCRVYKTPRCKQNESVVKVVDKFLKNGFSEDQIAILHPTRRGLNEIAKILRNNNMPVALDKDPDYDRSLTLIKWLEDLGWLCLNFFVLKSEANKSKMFNDLVLVWLRILQPQGFSRESDDEVRLHLAKLIWSIKDRDMRLGEWIYYVSNAMDFDSSLTSYERIFPGEVEELSHLQKACQPSGTLSGRMLSDFVNFTRGIHLTTLHSSKGMEFKVVLIAGVEKIQDDENGSRLLYVGVTRAEQEVCLFYSENESREAPKYITNLMERMMKYKVISKSHSGIKLWVFNE